MSLIKGAKEFFGLAPLDDEHDDAYYDEPRYADDGAAAYVPRYDRHDRSSHDRSTHDRAAHERSAHDFGRDANVGHSSYRAVSSSAVAVSDKYVPVIVAVEPRSYAEATQIGEPFRDGDAVTFELTHADRAVAKRLIDFAAGLCFATRGAMHNLSRGVDTDRRVFALVPEGADVTVGELQQAAGLTR